MLRYENSKRVHRHCYIGYKINNLNLNPSVHCPDFFFDFRKILHFCKNVVVKPMLLLTPEFSIKISLANEVDLVISPTANNKRGLNISHVRFYQIRFKLLKFWRSLDRQQGKQGKSYLLLLPVLLCLKTRSRLQYSSKGKALFGSLIF